MWRGGEAYINSLYTPVNKYLRLCKNTAFAITSIMTPIQHAAKAAIQKHGSLTAAADALGVSISYLSLLRNGKRESASAATLKKLGLSLVLSYKSRP